MKLQHLIIATLLVICIAAPAVAQLGDCNGYCDIPGMTVAQSQACWASQIHEEHSAKGNCSNWAYDDLNNRFVKGPGSCERQVNRGPKPFHVELHCTIASCSVVGTMTCGGRTHSYSLTCSGNSGGGAPYADGGAEEASCASSNPEQAGSPDFSAVQCWAGTTFTYESCATPAGGGNRVCNTHTD
jgi:hypothetical protein